VDPEARAPPTSPAERQPRQADDTLSLGLSLPPPDVAPLDRPLPRDAGDETLCIARYLEANSQRITLLRCTGEWAQPIGQLPPFEPRRTAA